MAIVIIVLQRNSAAGVVTVPSNGDPITTAVAAATPTDSSTNPGYISYNIPAYNPGALPNISSNTVLNDGINNITATDPSCCPGCAGDDTDNSTPSFYNAIMGLGGYAGAGASGLG